MEGERPNLSNPNQNRTGNEKMNFTNTDRQNSKMLMFLRIVPDMRWLDVVGQVKWKVKDQIYPIQTKIEQEMKK